MTSSQKPAADESKNHISKSQKRLHFQNLWSFATRQRVAVQSTTRDETLGNNNNRVQTRSGYSVTSQMGRILARLRPRNEATASFPFQALPYLCKLRILSFLDTMDKGVAAQVCREWNSLVRCPSVWSDVDLTLFMLHSEQPQRTHRCDRDCYRTYCQRMDKFHRYLTTVAPALRSFRFAYDIGDGDDGWMDWIESLLNASQCRELSSAYLNWKETAAKPFWPEGDQWSSEDYNELMHRHRQRQRQFVRFLDFFVRRAPNVSKLVMPFDWSTKSVQILVNLHRLETLVLEKYFVFQALDQALLDRLVQSLPHLKHLVIEVWTPSGSGTIFYTIRSRTLLHVDVSQSRGFFLKEVDLPNVTVFKASRHPWNGPLVTSDSLRMPCIHQVLADGTQNLQQINEHILRPDWKRNVYEELNLILKSMCSCRKHKSGWMM